MTIWTPEEQKEHRRLWVEALRSGKYQQGDGVLRSDGKFCCLGVACDISGLGEWIVEDGNDRYEFDGDIRSGGIPRAMLGYFGLKETMGEYGLTSLADQNDNGKPFTEIADIIESEPPGLVA